MARVPEESAADEPFATGPPAPLRFSAGAGGGAYYVIGNPRFSSY
jgi:hypothetical protein